jgi:hypothetical protein
MKGRRGEYHCNRCDRWIRDQHGTLCVHAVVSIGVKLHVEDLEAGEFVEA